MTERTSVDLKVISAKSISLPAIRPGIVYQALLKQAAPLLREFPSFWVYFLVPWPIEYVQYCFSCCPRP